MQKIWDAAPPPNPPSTVWFQSARIPVGGSWRRIDGRSKSGGEEQTRRSGGDLGSELISLDNQKPKRIFMALRPVLMTVLLRFPLLCGRLVFVSWRRKGAAPAASMCGVLKERLTSTLAWRPQGARAPPTGSASSHGSRLEILVAADPPPR